MDSSFHGAPISAVQMAPEVAAPSYNTVSGIRAPLTVDESDFECSVSSKSRRNSATSSYYSGSELEHEGFVSGEDDFETSSERHFESGILEETHFVKEYEVSKGSVVELNGEIFQERGNGDGNGFSRPFVRSPDGRIYEGISGGDEDDDSRGFMSDSGDEVAGNEDSVVRKGNSRPVVVVRDEDVSDNEFIPVMDVRIPSVKKLSVPIAQISGDSDEESQSSEALEEEGVSGIVRVSSIEVLQRINSAPKVRMSEGDEGDDYESQDENTVEMEFVEDLVISDGVLSHKDEREHIDVEGTIHSGVSADTIQDKGPDVIQEGRDNSSVVNEEYDSILDLEKNGDRVHLNEEIQESEVINDWIKSVDLVDHGEPVDLAEGTVFPRNTSSDDSAAEPRGSCGTREPMDDGDAKSSNASLEANLVFNNESVKLECESEEEIDRNVELLSSVADNDITSAYQCLEETLIKGDPEFPELPESLTESTQVDRYDCVFGDASTIGVSNASKSVFEDTFDQETRKEAEKSKQLLIEAAEIEREQDFAPLSGGEILLDHSQEIDDQIIRDSDDGMDEDNGISDRRQVIGSAALAAFLKALRENHSLESVSDDPGSMFRSTRPIVEARNPDLSMPSSTNGEPEEALSESEKKKLEKIRQLRVKYLRLLHRLGRSPEDSVASKVLYELTVAEARSSSQTVDFDSAKKAAIELETQMKDDLAFPLCILVVGKTGVGKSATINSLFGEKKTVVDAFEPATTRVQQIIGTIDGFKVKVFDTPGLSPTDESINRKVLSSIKKLMQKSPPDVVLYVDRLDTQTSNLNDLPLLRLVTSYLGSSIWQKSIVVLTHATSIPSDGPDGYPLSYEVFVAQKSRIVKQLISFSSGELLMNPGSMIPVSLVENHPFAKTNERGESNGESWRSQLLLSCYSIKTLSEVNSVLMSQNPLNHRKLFGLQIRSPALSYFLSSFLQSKSVDSDVELGYLSDSDEEDNIEYDNLPPFRPLTKTQIAKLSNDQRKAYFEEYDYRVKLLQKKQLREERRRFRNAKNGAPDETHMEGVPDQETILVPLPDMALPPSFDGENPSYRYRFVETSSQLLTRPVSDSHGWDHDCGYDGVLIEDNLSVSSRFPAIISVQLTKGKKDFHIQLHSSISSKHGDNGSSMAGLDIQSLGEKLAYTFKGETKIKNFKKNRTAAGVSITFLDENVLYGLKIEDHLAVGKRLTLTGNAGLIQSQANAAYGVNLDLCRRDDDYPIDQQETSIGLSITKHRGDLICGCNLQSQFSVGRNSKVNVRAGLNNKLSGQICIKTSCSDQLQLAAFAFLPIAKAIFKKLFPQSTKDYSR